MDITPFIRELLFSHECVIVPGFGGFIGNYSPAHIDKATSYIYPPAKQISFNRNLKNNDGLLAGRISEKAGKSFSEAVHNIEEFVSDVKTRIEKGEKAVFEKIGTFSNNHEGNIQFEPDRSENYFPGSYGLESFRFLPSEDYDVRKQIARHIDKDQERGHNARVILWRAAIIVPLVALATIVPLKTSLLRSKVETTTLNPIIKTESGSNLSVPLASETATPRPSVNADDNVTRVPGEKDIEPVTAEGRFCLITGSFKLRGNADQQIAVLKEAGFSPEVISASNGFFRVIAMKCPDLNTAIEKKDSLNKIFPGTWVRKI